MSALLPAHTGTRHGWPARCAHITRLDLAQSAGMVYNRITNKGNDMDHTIICPDRYITTNGVLTCTHDTNPPTEVTL